MAVSVADSDAEGLEDGTAPPDLWDYSPFDAVDGMFQADNLENNDADEEKKR